MNSKSRLVQFAWRTFLSGLVTVLPVAVTAYLVWWLVRTSESLFGGMARVVLPTDWYFPGLGLVLAIGLVFLVGAFLNAWLFRVLVELGERVVERIPIIKTIYGGVRDLFRFLSTSGTTGESKTVVSVEIQSDVWLVGFVTDHDAAQTLPEVSGGDDDVPLVAVYLPMGYQVGGYTLYLPASRVQSLDLSVEEAMRMVLTAGIDRPARTHGADSNQGA
jgi:uncharacterized membrane protein